EHFVWESRSNSAFLPAETETWVGGKEGVDVGGLRVQGRLDRVDALPDGQALFVIDYKSGKAPRRESGVNVDPMLQLSLYWQALETERPGACVVGAAYRGLKDQETTGWILVGWEDKLGSWRDGCEVVSEEEVAIRLAAARQAALAAVGEIRSGRIAPRAGRKCPEWCSLGAVCRLRRR
ncbi:MAG: PD-(D/E)XK nuclease family protein, partial [Thermoleophilia bacterium]|nr:PD-(D/E)XK nuclease family protein [Thermoleophilia bacterium]